MPYKRNFIISQEKGLFKKYKKQIENANALIEIRNVLRYCDVCLKLSNEELIELKTIAENKKEYLKSRGETC